MLQYGTDTNDFAINFELAPQSTKILTLLGGFPISPLTIFKFSSHDSSPSLLLVLM